MRLRMLVTLVSLLTASTAPLSAASIGLFSTRDCSSCNLTMSSIGTGHVFISVVTQGLPVPEVTGASFKVIGLPSGWLTLSTPSAASVIAAGDPFGSAGAGIGFGLPQIGECVLLHTVLVIRTSMESDVTLRVTQRTPPNNPQLLAPWFTSTAVRASPSFVSAAASSSSTPIEIAPCPSRRRPGHV